ncbi:hypothetical protein BJ138DRAFT_1103764 [Hygrophoropsis aurantiaca]|uniref:Uncharacterized protein n=1 Tax=Hygrophoropsis aurantiaca TaxID=72124 RepID=A0ACB8A442_9AGAM|nr:hypothetical protein BJ138DRAFT_1103764 [Hygrophoropsis aurantiaca]
MPLFAPSTPGARSRSSSLSSILTSVSSSPAESVSSSNVELLRVELMAAREELKRLKSDATQTKRAIKRARNELVGALEECTTLTTAATEFVTVRDQLLACPICHQVMQRPFTFCYGCLREYFQKLIQDRLALVNNLPDELKTAPYTAEDIHRIFVEERYLIYMWYPCFICQKDVKRKPTEHRALRELLDAATEAFGGPNLPAGEPMAPADLWADCWYQTTNMH